MQCMLLIRLIVFCARKFMRNICTGWDFVLSMGNICARFSPQCAIYALDFRKIVPISPMRNNCTRFAQDCTYFPNVQYMYKICTRFAQDCTISPMRNICARLYLFPQCAIYAQYMRKIVLLSPMRNICARFYHHLCTKHHHSAGHKIFYFLIQIDRSNYIQ